MFKLSPIQRTAAAQRTLYTIVATTPSKDFIDTMHEASAFMQ
jgi:hypothetical protein